MWRLQTKQHRAQETQNETESNKKRPKKNKTKEKQNKWYKEIAKEIKTKETVNLLDLYKCHERHYFLPYLSICIKLKAGCQIVFSTMYATFRQASFS